MGSNSSRSTKVHPNTDGSSNVHHVQFNVTEVPPSSSSNKYKEDIEQAPPILIRKKASLTFSNCDEYDGETLEDGVTFDGFGKYTFSGGDSYEGTNVLCSIFNVLFTLFVLNNCSYFCSS